MRFFHISDLHIGKHLHYYDLKEDQRYILSRIADAAEEQRPDAIVIAGDIYDRSSPSLTGSSPDWRTSGQPFRCWPLPGTMTRRSAWTMPVPSLEGSTSTWPACLLPGRKNE